VSRHDASSGPHGLLSAECSSARNPVIGRMTPKNREVDRPDNLHTCQPQTAERKRQGLNRASDRVFGTHTREGWGTCNAQQTCPSAVGSASGRTSAYGATTGASTFELGRAARARRFPLQICTTEFTNPTPSSSLSTTRLTLSSTETRRKVACHAYATESAGSRGTHRHPSARSSSGR